MASVFTMVGCTDQRDVVNGKVVRLKSPAPLPPYARVSNRYDHHHHHYNSTDYRNSHNIHMNINEIRILSNTNQGNAIGHHGYI